MGSGSTRPKRDVDDVADVNEPTLLYWPGSGPCRAVLMAARATNVHLETKVVDIFQNEEKVKFEKINPEKRLPMLMHKKKKITDSHEIMRYLALTISKKQKVYPDDEKKAIVDQMLQYDKKTVFPAVTGWLYPQIFQRKDPDPKKEAQIHSVLDHLDSTLKEQTFMATNHLTIADFSIVSSLSLLELKDYDLIRWTRVLSWMQQMRDVPYYATCNIGIEEWKFALHIQSETC